MSCYLCGGEDTETHHIVLRSECRPLEKCELNKVRLCTHCHDYLHHDSKGYKKLRALKFELQNKLEFLFDKEYLTREEIKEVLKISNKPLDRLLKPIVMKKGLYEREDVIRACMGGKILLERQAI
jgi:hypothetical protein